MHQPAYALDDDDPAARRKRGAEVWEELAPLADTPFHVNANQDGFFHEGDATIASDDGRKRDVRGHPSGLPLAGTASDGVRTELVRRGATSLLAAVLGVGLQADSYARAWQTASMLLPSGSWTNAA